MRSYFNQEKFQLSFDTVFHDVLIQCRDIPRHGQAGTWLTEDLMQSLLQLHAMGYAHSVEVWENGQPSGKSFMANPCLLIRPTHPNLVL